jgi:hypothetical protein
MLVLAVGCVVLDEADLAARMDGDADGVGASEDCDDADPAVGVAVAWYYDGDDDGWGDAASATVACAPPAGHVAAAGDCDDARADVHPGRVEVCDDADVDEDCDTLADDADPDVDPASRFDWFEDEDGDGWGGAPAGPSCDGDFDETTEGGDCDDSDPAVSPGALEQCGDGVDNDCDGGAWGCTLEVDDAIVITGVAPGDRVGHSVAVSADLAAGDWVLAASAPQRDNGVAWVTGTLSDTFGDSGMSFTASGEAAATMFGWAIEFVPDTGDGDPDIAISGPWSTTGSVQLLSGLVALFSVADKSDHDVADARAVLRGETASDAFGFAVGPGRKLGGEAASGLVVGAPGYWGAACSTRANVYWFESVPDGEWSGPDKAAWVASTAFKSDCMGWALAGGDDLDGDGLGDLAVGAPGRVTGADGGGAVVLFRGPLAGAVGSDDADVSITSDVGGGQLGYAVVNAGDVNGDGLHDLWASQPHVSTESSAARVWLLLGPVEASGEVAEVAAASGEGEGGGFGFALQPVPDADGDSRPEVAVGAPFTDHGGSDSGTVYLFLSSTVEGGATADDAAATFQGEGGSLAGWSLEAGSDLDGNGAPEMVIGMPGYRSERGGVAVIAPDDAL